MWAGFATGFGTGLPLDCHWTVANPPPATTLFGASPLCSKVALADSVEDPLGASPLCSKVALADSVQDPLEASPLRSRVALADSVQDPLEASPLRSSKPRACKTQNMIYVFLFLETAGS